MNFAVKEVSLNEIPEKKSFGCEPTERSKWCVELLETFLESGAGIWELCEGMDGKFKSSKDTLSYGSSLQSQTKKSRFKGVSIVTRGRRIFISRVRVIQTKA